MILEHDGLNTSDAMHPRESETLMYILPNPLPTHQADMADGQDLCTKFVRDRPDRLLRCLHADLPKPPRSEKCCVALVACIIHSKLHLTSKKKNRRWGSAATKSRIKCISQLCTVGKYIAKVSVSSQMYRRRQHLRNACNPRSLS